MFSCDTRNSPAQKVNEYQYEGKLQVIFIEILSFTK